MSTDHGPGRSGPGWSLRRWRSIALLAIGIVIGVAMTATPVSAHVGSNVTHLWKTHLRPKADARYYTKLQANARYVPRGAKVSDADALDGLDSLAFLRSDGKAADAELLDGLDSLAFLRSDGKAADADELDGLDSTDFLLASGKAADAELLDGLDSTELVHGNGETLSATTAFEPGAADFFLVLPDSTGSGGGLIFIYSCPAVPTAEDGTISILSLSPEAMNLFWESGEANPTYVELTDSVVVPTTAAGDSYELDIQSPTMGVVSLDVATVHRAGDCHLQAQGLRTG